MNKTDILKNLIANTGLSTKAFSEKCDIPYTTLRSILERNVEKASVDNVLRICSVLNITIEELYELSGDSISDAMLEDKMLSYNERQLLNNFDKLNDFGKEEAIKRVDELAEINKYTDDEKEKVIEFNKEKTEYKPTTFAAHDDDLTEDEKKTALEIAMREFEKMDDEDFSI